MKENNEHPQQLRWELLFDEWGEKWKMKGKQQNLLTNIDIALRSKQN